MKIKKVYDSNIRTDQPSGRSSNVKNTITLITFFSNTAKSASKEPAYKNIRILGTDLQYPIFIKGEVRYTIIRNSGFKKHIIMVPMSSLYMLLSSLFLRSEADLLDTHQSGWNISVRLLWEHYRQQPRGLLVAPYLSWLPTLPGNSAV